MVLYNNVLYNCDNEDEDEDERSAKHEDETKLTNSHSNDPSATEE